VTLLPLASQSPTALQEALVERGVDPSRADAAAHGLRPLAAVFDGIDEDARDAVANAARGAGVECLTGDGWALLAGGAARLAGLARPGSSLLPPELADQLSRFVGTAFESALTWPMGRGTVDLESPVVVGVLNVTPDSFSDGGRYLDTEAALEHGDRMVEEGADMLDVGAESTRPGRPAPVPSEEEWRRLEPVLKGLVRRHPGLPLSVDTVKAETAARALDAGAWAVNDVSGLRIDPQIAEVCAERDAGLVLMHSRGDVSDMATYDHAAYAHVVGEVARELTAAVERGVQRGVARERVVIDPGLGFSKTPQHNYEVLRGLPTLVALGHPVMVGPSRKRFLGAVTGRDVDQRDPATAAACVAAHAAGAALFRVHAVAPVREALTIAHAVGSA
jgi:dihydropteroate synthase